MAYTYSLWLFDHHANNHSHCVWIHLTRFCRLISPEYRFILLFDLLSCSFQGVLFFCRHCYCCTDLVFCLLLCFEMCYCESLPFEHTETEIQVSVTFRLSQNHMFRFYAISFFIWVCVCLFHSWSRWVVAAMAAAVVVVRWSSQIKSSHLMYMLIHHRWGIGALRIA